MNERALLLLLPICWLGCRSAAPLRPEGTLVLHVEGPAPLCYVDDVPVTLFPGGTRITVLAGRRRIEVRAPGHFAAYREVQVPPRGQAELSIRLRPDPDAGSSLHDAASTRPWPPLDRADRAPPYAPR
ncbi:MAG: hypothetical protein RMK29_04135 [Myxococcales bacterium]|nr:hypothetical protein [Myxococcales bacterium]